MTCTRKKSIRRCTGIWGVELNLATGGRINMWIDGTNNEMHQGDWAIVNTGEFHLNTWVEPTDIYEGLTVLISRFFLDSWLKEDVRFVYPTDKKRQAGNPGGVGTVRRIKTPSGSLFKSGVHDAAVFSDKASGTILHCGRGKRQQGRLED